MQNKRRGLGRKTLGFLPLISHIMFLKRVIIHRGTPQVLCPCCICCIQLLERNQSVKTQDTEDNISAVFMNGLKTGLELNSPQLSSLHKAGFRQNWSRKTCCAPVLSGSPTRPSPHSHLQGCSHRCVSLCASGPPGNHGTARKCQHLFQPDCTFPAPAVTSSQERTPQPLKSDPGNSQLLMSSYPRAKV